MPKLEHADIIGVFGGTGSGKSYRVMQLTKRDKRLLVWDVLAEYPGAVVTEWPHLMRLLRLKKFRIAFRPGFQHLEEEFDRFCRLAWAVGNMRIVAEELNKVTKPGHAPSSWQNLTSRGRHRGLHIIGISQRPAGVDKDFFGMCTEIYAGRLTYDRDRKALAPVIGDAKAAQLANMADHKQIHWRSR